MREEFIFSDLITCFVSVPFTVDSTSGIIQTKKELDGETVEQYVFPMYVKDDGVPPFTASTTVRIDVNDLNDNVPEFGSLRGYKAKITEDDTLSVGVQEVDIVSCTWCKTDCLETMCIVYCLDILYNVVMSKTFFSRLIS